MGKAIESSGGEHKSAVKKPKEFVTIDKTTIDKTQPAETDKFIWDSALPGFGFKVTPTGHRSFVLQYRIDGRTRRYTIGELTDALTPAQARKRAKSLLRDIGDGRDPMATKIARRNALAVDDLLDAYIRSPTFKAKATTTQAIDTGRINAHIRPLIGRLIADRVTHDDIVKMRSDIAAGKTAKTEKGDRPRGRRVVRGGEGAAGQSVTLLSAAFTWAINEDRFGISSSPAAKVKGHVSQRRNIAAQPGDYAKIFAAIQKLEDERRIPSPAADAVRLIALVGLRRGEASGLRWRNVDINGKQLVFAPAEHKGGKRTGEAKTIFLADAAVEILKRQSRREDDALVFPPASGETGIRLNRPWNLVRDEAKLSKDFVLHGLRHAIGATLALDGASVAAVAAALGHKQTSTAERYISWANDSRRELAERAARRIAADVIPEERGDDSEV